MFYQNVFNAEFLGNLVLSDRQYSMTFKVRGNSPNDSQVFQAWNPAPYNLGTNVNLVLNYSFDSGESWTPLSINVSTGADNIAAVTAYEIVSTLNSNPTFAALFTAVVITDNKGFTYVCIRSLRPREKFKVYVSNGSAEKRLRFNKRAGVAELPTYFARHTIDNKRNFPDSLGLLIELDDSDPVDQQIITEAGLDYATVQEDWQLFRGRSGFFNFQNITVDGSDRITEIIQYPAGALAGDLAKKIQYAYSGGNKSPSQVTEIPYTLTDPDLVTP